METRAILIHAVTEYDRKQEKRPHHNSYALPQYFTAIDEAMELIKKGHGIRRALTTVFCGALLDITLKAIGETKSTHQEQIF